MDQAHRAVILDQLADHLEPFLGWLRPVRGRSPYTIDVFRKDLRQFLAFVDAVDRRRPEHVDHRLIEAYLGWLQSPAIGRKATTVIQHLYAIESWCLYLSREGIISRNTSAEAFGPKKTLRLPHNYLSIDEQEALLRALQQRTTLLGRRDYALIAFALFTRARCEELATVPLAHLHLDAGRVLIHGKGAKDREVPLVPRLVAVLRAYLADVRPVLLGPSSVPFLFVRARREWRSGRRKPSDAIQWGATRNRVRAGLPILTRTIWAVLDRTVSPLVGRHISPHDLRHSFATRLRSQGADLQYVQQLLGHANIQTTTIYSHLVSVSQRDELARYLQEGG